MNAVGRLLTSSANWCGLAVAAVPLVLKAAQMLGPIAFALALAGYAIGYFLGGSLFGFPRLGTPAWDADLTFFDTGDVRRNIESAIEGIRGLVHSNPDQRLSGVLRDRTLEICQKLESLLAQWESSKGALSLEEEFHARHIALSYLPDALKGYLAIPKAFAAERVLDNGRTAHDTLALTLDELSGKVGQLQDDLAGQDAQAFLSHSRFIDNKFASRSLT
jgi:hypothetical protein